MVPAACRTACVCVRLRTRRNIICWLRVIWLAHLYLVAYALRGIFRATRGLADSSSSAASALFLSLMFVSPLYRVFANSRLRTRRNVASRYDVFDA